MLPKLAPFSTLVSRKSWCLNQEQWICKSTLILMFISITKIVLIFKTWEANVFAKYLLKRQYYFLNFLENRITEISIDFQSSCQRFRICRHKTFTLYGSKVVGRKVKGTTKLMLFA